MSHLFAVLLVARASDAVSPQVLAGLREDLLPVVVGIFLTGLALVVGALALLRRRELDRAPLYFALFTGIYGARLALDSYPAELLLGVEPVTLRIGIAVLSYLIPVPFIRFVELMIGPGWKLSIRRLWQLHLLFAAVAVPYEIVREEPFALATPYRILVVLGLAVALVHIYRPGRPPSAELRWLRGSMLVLGLFVLNENLEDLNVTPWQLDAEWLGFLCFLGVLGWIAAHRAFETRRRLVSIQQELETARRIQESILPAGVPQIPGLDLAVRYVPAEEVAGDFYDFLPGEGRRLGILVADVSGHGIPAALIASMVKIAVAAQTDHAASPGRVLTEMNRIFHGKLKGNFVTAVYAFVDLDEGRLTWASAGHPPPLLWRSREGRVEELRQDGLVLGRLSRAAYREMSVPLAPGDRLLLFTDGIPEAQSPSGEPFGDGRLQQTLAEGTGLAADPFATDLLRRISAWTGRAAEADDLTLVVLGVV